MVGKIVKGSEPRILEDSDAVFFVVFIEGKYSV